ncbi:MULTISPECIES: hypothetical protein [unclassified Frigoribacterium]|nr:MULTISPECIES: hypothetical protein [unclassified Frigoribacterium]WAC51313.1 hypothetical protein OVA02_15965 [Frigoribacterium sp. SL97]
MKRPFGSLVPAAVVVASFAVVLSGWACANARVQQMRVSALATF